MKKILSMSVVILLFGSSLIAKLPFDKVIIWGYKLHSHTHSYIHHGYYRAFKQLGYETYWVDNGDGNSIDHRNALFIFMGNDQNIPIRDDAFYIIHNGPFEKFKLAFEQGRAIIQQVYTHDVLSRALTKLDTCLYYSIKDQILYMPWATDLLPSEIDAIKAKLAFIVRRMEASYVGTIWSGEFGNENEIDRFKQACTENGICFKNITNLGMEDTITQTQISYLAPAIQGKWQCEKGYIPCRIFKNISYGQLGITNNPTVYELFDRKIVFDPDTYQLFYKAQARLASQTIDEQCELMDFVRNKHTYINRIETLLWLLEEVYHTAIKRIQTSVIE